MSESAESTGTDGASLPEVVVLSAPRNGTNYFCECLDGLPEVVGLYEIFNPGGVYGTGRENLLPALVQAADVRAGSETDPELIRFFREQREEALSALAEAVRHTGRGVLAYKVFPSQVEHDALIGLLSAPHRRAMFLVRDRLSVYVSYRKALLAESWKHTDTSGIRPEIDADDFLAWSRENDVWFERIADALDGIGKGYRVLSYARDVDRPKGELLRDVRATLAAEGLRVTLPTTEPRQRFQRQDVRVGPFDKIANGDAVRAELTARGELEYALGEPLADRDGTRGLTSATPPTADEIGENPLLLPERARLLHIGLPKTGTTALQRTAVRLRGPLLRAGVVYPRTLTKRHDHLIPAAALMERKLAETNGVPGREHWDDLMSTIDADDERRIWISHEWISESDEAQVRRFRDELGDRVHVVVSVRPFGTILTSTWQEFLKSTMLHDFESWVEYVLTDRAAPDSHTRWQVAHLAKRASQGDIVERWARIVGPENVTVVVVDPAHRDQLTDAFEDMLGLDRGFLKAEDDGSVANRSMTVEEASVMLALNRAYADPASPLTKRQGRLPMRLPHALLGRTPGPGERKLTLPRWAAEIADARSAAQADQIDAAGVRVVGDLEVLRSPSRATGDAAHNSAPDVPVDTAVRASIGLVEDADIRARVEIDRLTDERDAARQGAETQRSAAEDRGPLVDETSAVALLGYAAGRAARRVRRAVRKDR
ncbi:hypothetical protein [Microbacterium sp. G2-8]|uniref:hypothetical protein n=1 Tax=Microbacterium sp. G2-8 TaxID=2842454 RepID=UPI001C8A49C4|nr:hypothetical protein [Microbacterium sp. G2-8]